MEASFVIVTKNRPGELEFTLSKLKDQIDLTMHEVLVFVDDCQKTEDIIHKFDWVKWQISHDGIGASPARNKLYKKAIGTFFIGLDDDAHIITTSFISKIKNLFSENPKIGIIAFQEIRGLFLTDDLALKHRQVINQHYYTNDFVGCGFAITKEVYQMTNGFPVWIDIYGEESCVAIEVINLGYEILYDNSIIVNHRVDQQKRLNAKHNYYRFEKQLKNTFNFYLVYYPNPIFSILKLLFHNFKKYALRDITYFKLFFKSLFIVFKQLFLILKQRKPVKKSIILKMKTLQNIKY
jgi:GT2 family glycosyltransferase